MVSKCAIWGLGSSLYLSVTRSDSPPDFVSNSRRPEVGERTQAIVVDRRMKWRVHNTVGNVEGLLFVESYFVFVFKVDGQQYRPRTMHQE